MSQTLHQTTQRLITKIHKRISGLDIVIMRLCVIAIFFLFGSYKWFEFEVYALEPLISATWLNIIYVLFGIHGGSYFLGFVETITALALLGGYIRPGLGAIGALLAVLTGLVTLSLMIRPVSRTVSYSKMVF